MSNSPTIKLYDSCDQACLFDARAAKDAIEALQKFVEEQKHALRPGEIKHGFRVYFDGDERMVVGGGNLFYLIDTQGRLQYGVHGPVSAERIIAAGYTRDPGV